tara:strand:+ start:534 stop:743 length:210 start_codon:yes stop_codon:yes gene_type:complete
VKVGDLVKYAHPDSFNDYGNQVGVIVEVNSWADKGAPDRNFGINVVVSWPNGQIETFDEYEIDIIEHVS